MGMEGFMRVFVPLLAAAVLGLTAQSASAGVVIVDNFTNTVPETPALNWTGDGIFNPVPAIPMAWQTSVDLVSPCTWPTLVPNSHHATASLIRLNAVDLDGSTGTGFTPAGVLQSTATLVAGTYAVNFWLAGN